MRLAAVSLLALMVFAPAARAQAGEPAAAAGDDRYDVKRLGLDLNGAWQVLEGQDHPVPAGF
jgi:hypothetical protein